MFNLSIAPFSFECPSLILSVSLRSPITLKHFIDIEDRYGQIMTNKKSVLDFIMVSINQIENNTKDIDILKNDLNKLKKSIDIRVQNDYCLASDIAEQLKLYYYFYTSVLFSLGRNVG